MKTYIDKTTCGDGHRFAIRRQVKSAGKKVNTFCPTCRKNFQLIAGPVKQSAFNEPEIIPKKRWLKERDIEAYLNKRVKELGGESRKVRWVGRSSAPDRIVMLPWRDEWNAEDHYGIPDQTIWIEVKAPGKGATFPANAHERAQHREHERMRKMGQRVEVVDCYERVEEILK